MPPAVTGDPFDETGAPATWLSRPDQVGWGKLGTGWPLEGVIIVTGAWEERQKALRVLEAAVAEAGGKPDEHVFALPVMRKAGVTNAEFRTAAGYLDEQGWVAGGGGEYETFVVTPEGVDRISGGRSEAPRTEKKEEETSSSDDDEES
jgi:hypothetical protein